VQAHAHSKILLRVSVQIPDFSIFFFFCSSFYYLFVNKKNLFVELSRRTMLVRSTGSTLASTFFLHLTPILDGSFLKLIETVFCKLLLWFVIKLCLKWSLILRSLHWMAGKRTCMLCGQILVHTQNFTISSILALLANTFTIDSKNDSISWWPNACCYQPEVLSLHLFSSEFLAKIA